MESYPQEVNTFLDHVHDLHLSELYVLVHNEERDLAQVQQAFILLIDFQQPRRIGDQQVKLCREEMIQNLRTKKSDNGQSWALLEAFRRSTCSSLFSLS